MKRPLVYALHRPIVDQLLQTRRDLWAAARGMTGAEMRASVGEIMAGAELHVTPRNDAELAASYEVLPNGEGHIDVEGLLTPAVDVCGAFGLESETEYGFIIAATQAADADPSVKTIVYDFNTGGGYVDGCDLAAQAIAGASKPTRADIYDMAASAGYWLAAQCDKIVAMSPTVNVGSIGVAAEEMDDTGALAAQGVVRRVYSSTEAPLKRPDTSTEEGQAVVVGMLDATHKVFVDRVASGRHVPAADVNSNFGRGGLVIASEALKAGMIDKIMGRNIERAKPGVAGTAPKAEDRTQEEVMDLKDLTPEMIQKDRPDLITAMTKPAVDAAITAERKRVSDLETHLGINAAVDLIIQEGKATGATFADLQAKISAAAIANAKPAENPPQVDTATADGPGGSSDGWTPDERAKAKKAGLTDEEIAKYGPKGREGK